MLMNFIQEFLSNSSILVGISGLYIAWQGLGVWRKQLKGNVEYEVARKILFLTYKIRRGVEVVRNPFMSIYEMYDFDFPEGLSEKEKEEMGIRRAYVKRYELLNGARDQLLVDVLEGEVLWGKELRKRVYDYFGVIKMLDLAVSDYLQMRSPEGRAQMGEEYVWKRQKEVHEIIYDFAPNSTDANPEDKYAVDLIAKISEIEKYLKHYLHRS